MNSEYTYISPTAATSGPITIDVSKTATSELDIGPLMAASWRRWHADRLASGAKYWKRRPVPRWVKYIEATDRLRKAMNKLVEAGAKSEDT